MEPEVRKSGEALVLVLSKKIAGHLGNVDGAPRHPAGAQGANVPYDPGFEVRMDKAADIICRYSKTLRVLAR